MVMPEDEIAARKRKRESNDATMDRNEKTTSPTDDTSYRIVDIRQWLNGWAEASTGDEQLGVPSRATLPLVDLRSYEDFDKCHLSFSPTATATATGDDNTTLGAANGKNNAAQTKTDTKKHNGDAPIVNLPLSTLLSGERSCELPPRHVEFAILIPRQSTQAFFQDNNKDCSIHELFFASQSKSTMQSRKPWLVRQVLMEDDGLWNDAKELGVMQYNCSQGSSEGDDKLPFRRLPRLWKPDPLISSEMLPLLKRWMKETEKSNPDNTNDYVKSNTIDSEVGLVLDLGSGSGRDICYLAEEIKEFQHLSLHENNHPNHCVRSVRFVGLDNHKGSAKRCMPLWKNRGVDDITDPLLLDLNKLHRVRDHFMNVSKLQSKPVPNSKILCIFAIRFLNRRLLSYIANSQSTDDAILPEAASASSSAKSKSAIHSPPPPVVLPLGTLLAISHFCKPHDGAAWNFDHPKQSSVLERWELKNLFEGVVSQKGDDGTVPSWEIVKDDICTDGDHGRTLIQFIARKVA